MNLKSLILGVVSLLLLSSAALAAPLRRYEVDPSKPRPANCDPSYPDANMCIPRGTPDLNCPNIPHFKNFTVRQPDPHGFDRDQDGKCCENNPGK